MMSNLELGAPDMGSLVNKVVDPALREYGLTASYNAKHSDSHYKIVVERVNPTGRYFAKLYLLTTPKGSIVANIDTSASSLYSLADAEKYCEEIGGLVEVVKRLKELLGDRLKA